MRHGTLKEVFSRILYDPNVDPSEIVIIFLDSRKYRCIPFTFIKPAIDGFYYRGNFYPLHKIIAIKNEKTGKYMLKRRAITFRVESDIGIDLPDFPVSLGAIYDDFILQRYASAILNFIHSRIIKSHEDEKLSWLRSLGDYRKINLDDMEIYLILSSGAFRGTMAIFAENQFRKIIRSIPTPINLSNIYDDVSFFCVTVQRFHGTLKHIFIIDSKILCAENITRLSIYDNKSLECFLRRNKNISIFLSESNSQQFIIAICDQNEKKFLKINEEKIVGRQINLPLSPIIRERIRVRELGALEEDSLLKIHDFDIIFSIAK